MASARSCLGHGRHRCRGVARRDGRFGGEEHLGQLAHQTGPLGVQFGHRCLDEAGPGLGLAEVEGVEVEPAVLGVGDRQRDAQGVGRLVAICAAHPPVMSAEGDVQLGRVARHRRRSVDRRTWVARVRPRSPPVVATSATSTVGVSAPSGRSGVAVASSAASAPARSSARPSTVARGAPGETSSQSMPSAATRSANDAMASPTIVQRRTPPRASSRRSAAW